MTKKNLLYLLIIIINLTLLSVILIKEKTVDEISSYYSAEELIKDNMISMVEVNESGETIAINAVPVGDNWYAVCECTNGSIEYYGKSKKFAITNIDLTNGPLKCKVTFKISKPIKEQILANSTSISDANVDFSKTSEVGNTNGLYYTANVAYGEDNTKIYYYRGNVENNWVSFGGYYWRIVRTTSEGGVKLIYSGGNTATGISSLTASSAFINISAKFNTSYNLKYYAGYTYNASAYESNTQTDATIKCIVDGWYTGTNVTCDGTSYTFSSLQTKLIDYNSYLSTTAVYCSDRSAELDSSGNAWTSGQIYYPIFFRLALGTNKIPTYACPSTNASRYTVSVSSGDGYLVNPVALISADEVSYAGVVYYSNGSTLLSYIMDNSAAADWYTMTPSGYRGGASDEWYIQFNGNLSYGDVTALRGVRPLISLNKCVSVIEGDGTKTSPYKLTDALCK